MSALYHFPKAAAFGKILPKSKIYEHATPSTKVKELFVRDIEKITWAYKLSPATINLPASDSVQEIQIFFIELKNGSLSHEVLQTIDKAIPSPILFELQFNGKTRYVAAYKRPSEVDKSKWVTSGYFETDWLKRQADTDQSELKELPVVLNMGALYEALLKDLIPFKARDNESLANLVQRVAQLRIKERETDKLGSRMKKEKQFKRRVEFNRLLNKLKQEIDNLKR